MQVEHYPCAPPVNESEALACRQLLNFLRRREGNAQFALLTNLAYSIGPKALPDEIDLVIVGSSGVSVVEIKHWDRSYLKRNAYNAEDAANRIAEKARRIAGNVRSITPNVFVKPKMLLTREAKSLRRPEDIPFRGVELYALSDLEALFDMPLLGSIPDGDVDRICRALAPRSGASLGNVPRRIGQITDLALLSPTDDRFHRIYRGRNAITQDRLIVHVFDISARDAPGADRLAQREFNVVQKLQKSPWLPTLVDSYQPLPGYDGELFFYSLAECDAPTLEEGASDEAWGLSARIRFAAQTLDALAELHEPVGDDPVVIHRMLTPTDICIRKGERPLFSGWHWAKMPLMQTVSGTPHPLIRAPFAAPEVAASGLAIADARSDVFSTCACLATVFQSSDTSSESVREILKLGMAIEPGLREKPRELAGALRKLLSEAMALPLLEQQLGSEFWDDGTVLMMHNERFKILSRLGRGSVGRTFKLEQIDRTDQSLGTYVGKVVFNESLGDASLNAYKKLRSIAHHENLASIYQTATEWSPNSLLALLRWIEGAPLGDYAGLLELLAQDRSEGFGPADAETLALKWTGDLCDALSALHRHGLAHGDVSPANIIVSDEKITLIDYDLVTEAGAVAPGGAHRLFVRLQCVRTIHQRPATTSMP